MSRQTSVPVWPVGMVLSAAGGMLIEAASTHAPGLRWLAEWQNWLGDGGLVGAAVGVLTLILVWRTVVYAREAADAGNRSALAAANANKQALLANEIARDAVYEQRRAWLKVAKVNLASDIVWGAQSGNTTVFVDLENIGLTAATNINVTIRFLWGFDVNLMLEEFDLEASREAYKKHGYTLFPGEIHHDGLINIQVAEVAEISAKYVAAGIPLPARPSLLFLRLLVSVTYRSAGDTRDRSHATTVMYDVAGDADRQTPLAIGPGHGNTPLSALTIRRSPISDVRVR